MLLVITEKQFFATDILRSVRARPRYREPSELFSQESTEADVANFISRRHLRFSRPTRISGES